MNKDEVFFILVTPLVRLVMLAVPSIIKPEVATEVLKLHRYLDRLMINNVSSKWTL